MEGRLTGKRIIVIGGATGIGAATVRRLVREGAKVVIGDINSKGATALASALSAEGASVAAVSMDLAEEESINAAVAQAVEFLGGLDGAHVNAADLRTIMDDSTVLEESIATFDRTIAVNLRGHFLSARAVLPHLLQNGGGTIVFTSSDAADMGDPVRPAYAASKSGLNALMRNIATCYGRQGITSNAIAPGFVITAEQKEHGVLDGYIEWAKGLTPSTRLGEGDDIAGVAAMLLSEDGRWINGQVFHVNGGAVLR